MIYYGPVHDMMHVFLKALYNLHLLNTKLILCIQILKAKSQPFASCFSLYVQAVEDTVGHHLPELFQCHGTADELVSHSWGDETCGLLKKAGMNTSFHSFPGLNHQLCQPELELLRSWILKKLPCETSSTAKS